MRARRHTVFLALVVIAAAAIVAAPSASATTSVGAAPRPDPVLLVHGFRGSSSGWHALESSLLAAGYRSSEIDAIDYGADASNVAVAHQIAHEVTALRARTGATHVDLVSHSMGAISSRYYLERLGGGAHVDAWVSLAGVNEGTVWAYGCYVLTPCREMVPTSSVLHRINDGFHPHGPTRYGSWWSPCDEAVVPPSNAELAGAHNVETRCLEHSALRTDPTVLAQVTRFLRAPTTRT